MKKYIPAFLFLIFSVGLYFYVYHIRPQAGNSNETGPARTRLSREYDRILFEGEIYRSIADSIRLISGNKSYKVDSVYRLAYEADSINSIRVKRILDSVGWPGRDVVGANGQNALFMIIQNSDIKTQEKYLPLVRDAVKKDLLPPSSLALLEDRVLLRQGKKQIYGSQVGYDEEKKVYYILPLSDPDSVDIRRFKAGLEPISLYAAHFKITWNLEKYKADLRYYEALEKNRPK